MEENKNLETLGGLCNYMLSSPMPISEINGEGASPDDTGLSDLHSLSDVVLCRLAGFTLEKLMQSEM